MPEPSEAAQQPEPKSAAIRAYLSATIVPALLKGLVEMEKEECVLVKASACRVCAHTAPRANDACAGASDPSSGWRSTCRSTRRVDICMRSRVDRALSTSDETFV